MLARLEWLLDSAEFSLRRIERGSHDYIAAWECATSARHILTHPMGYDDRRKLGLDVDKTLHAVHLTALNHHWHAVLRAFPERGEMVRRYDLLAARLGTIERLMLSLMRTMREQVCIDRCTYYQYQYICNISI